MMKSNERFYTQKVVSLAPEFKAQDDGVSFTIVVPASSRAQAARRIKALLYGRGTVDVSMLTAAKKVRV